MLEDLDAPGEARLHWQTTDVAPGFYTIPVTAATDRQSTTDLFTWETISIKEGTQPWNEGSLVIEDPISPSRSIIKVFTDRGRDDDRFRSFRLIVQSIDD